MIKKRFDYCFQRRENHRKINRDYNLSLSSHEIPGTTRINSFTVRWTKDHARYFTIIVNQRMTLRRMPLELRIGRIRASFDIFERIIPRYTCPWTCVPIQDAIFERYTYTQGERGTGGIRGNDKSGSSNKYSESRPGRARGIRARMELFSRAPNRTLICDSDCHKLKGMPTLSLSLLHDLFDLINARCALVQRDTLHPLARMIMGKTLENARVNVRRFA